MVNGNDTLAEAIKKIAKPNRNEIADVVMGEVTSLDPIKIKIDVEKGYLELEEPFLIFSFFCFEQIISVPNVYNEIDGVYEIEHKHIVEIPSVTTSAGGDPSHAHTVPAQTVETELAVPKIRLWRGLDVGDKVIMFKLALGQKFFVSQRVGNVLDENLTP